MAIDLEQHKVFSEELQTEVIPYSIVKEYIEESFGKTEEEAIQTVSERTKEQGEACHFEKVTEGRYIVYRTRDKKVMKSINYFRPNLKKFFNND